MEPQERGPCLQGASLTIPLGRQHNVREGEGGSLGREAGLSVPRLRGGAPIPPGTLCSPGIPEVSRRWGCSERERGEEWADGHDQDLARVHGGGGGGGRGGRGRGSEGGRGGVDGELHESSVEVLREKTSEADTGRQGEGRRGRIGEGERGEARKGEGWGPGQREERSRERRNFLSPPHESIPAHLTEREDAGGDRREGPEAGSQAEEAGSRRCLPLRRQGGRCGGSDQAGRRPHPISRRLAAA